MENRLKTPEKRALTAADLMAIVLLLTTLNACTHGPDSVQLQQTVNAQAATWNAQQTDIYSRIPTRTPTPSTTPRPYEPKRIAPVLCADVADGGSIIQALTDANKGILPQKTDPDGYPYSVLVDHQDPATLANTRYIMTLSKVLLASPIVSKGDKVCFSSEPSRFNSFPTPTPGPRPASYNNLRSRSFAVAVNRP